jgi:hypothetical protein
MSLLLGENLNDESFYCKYIVWSFYLGYMIISGCDCSEGLQRLREVTSLQSYEFIPDT